MNVLEALERARADYAENGYAKGESQDDAGHRCAVGSLRYVLHGDAQTPCGDDEVYMAARDALDVAADGCRGGWDIVLVNDDLGHDKTLACFDEAIRAVRDA